MNQSPEAVLQILREKVGQSEEQLGRIFLAFDKNRDGYMSEAEFVSAFQQCGIVIAESVLKKAY